MKKGKLTGTNILLPACIFYPLILLYLSSSYLSLLDLILHISLLIDTMLNDFLPLSSKYLLNEQMKDATLSFFKVSVRFCKLGIKTALSWSILSGHEINQF